VLDGIREGSGNNRFETMTGYIHTLDHPPGVKDANKLLEKKEAVLQFASEDPRKSTWEKKDGQPADQQSLPTGTYVY